jgi:alpha-beta hydrolase superfamily lysophospholipase
VTHAPTPWEPDVLGEGWESTTLRLRPDDAGEPVATLVRRAGRPGERSTRRAVLYVPGFIDYFFQTHVGDSWAEAGFDFYALDLRDHGRSIRPGRLANYTTDLAVHAEELDRAARIIREEEGHDVLLLQGHSTGGLLGVLWTHARRDRTAGPLVDALVLNSPWFDLNRGWWDRVVTTQANRVLARVTPHLPVGSIHDAYGQWLQDPERGRWVYDAQWKPLAGFPARSAWFAGIRRGHRAVARGLDIRVPVLVCTADASGPADRDHEAIGRTDSVLDVEHMWRHAPRLGTDVTVVRIPDGVHDLALSSEPARSTYLDAVQEWVGRTV